MMKNLRKKKRSYVIFLFCLIILFSLGIVFYSYLNNAISVVFAKQFNVLEQENNLLVHYISVGQADSIAVNLPDGKVMLIDAGLGGSATTLASYLRGNVLNAKFGNKIDYFVLTHFDTDHYGGALKILKEFDVEMVVCPTVESSGETYNALHNYLYGDECSANVINVKDAVDVFNGFTIEYLHGDPTETEKNAASTVVKITYLNKSFLFMGDATKDSENYYLTHYGNKLDVDVLKVGHHGSTTSSGDDFLEMVSPDYAIICCGLNNKYNLPKSEVLTKLNNIGAQILRTDLDGNIVFAVSTDYEMLNLTSDYTVVGQIVDCRIIIVAIDGLMVLQIIVLLIPKNKSKNK